MSIILIYPIENLLREKHPINSAEPGQYGTATLTGENGMYLLGVAYNVCWRHQQLSTHGQHISPAMASGLTDHLWSWLSC